VPAQDKSWTPKNLMPELPEVEITRRGIATHLKDQIIQSVIVREKRLRWEVPDTLTTVLPGQQVQQIHRRGKYILIECNQGYIIIHLGMSGSLRVLPSDTPLKKHDHLDIVFTQNICLRYHDPRRFGCVLWTTEPILNHRLLVNLGIEPLETELMGEDLHRHAQGRRVAVKQYIMNAQIIVGVGNIYANEALFLAGIHPNQAAGSLRLEDYQRLAYRIKQVLNEAIEMGGTTLRDFTDSAGNLGYFKQSLRVYGRAGLACMQCGNMVEQQKIGQRATYYCPVCQSKRDS
jgi:formamidopyrimidine-DNA glycosylase